MAITLTFTLHTIETSSMWKAVFILVFLHNIAYYGQADVEISLSERGLYYIVEKFVNFLINNIINEGLPDYLGEVSLTNFKISEFTIPKIAIRLNEGTDIAISLSNLSFKVKCNWSYEKDIWVFTVKDSGTITSSTNIAMGASVGMSSHDGRPMIRVHGCSTIMPDLILKVGGSWTSFLYNLLIKLFSGIIKSKLEDVFCQRALDLLNTKVAQKLDSLNLQQKISKNLSVDLSLLKAPYFGTNFLKIILRGQFIGDDSPRENIPMITSTNNMIGVAFSENILNSAFTVLYKILGGKLIHTLHDLSKILSGRSIAGLQINGPIDLNVHADDVPRASISPKGISANFSGTCEAILKLPFKAPERLISIDFAIGAAVRVNIDSNIIRGSVTGISPTFIMIISPMPGILNSVINESISGFLNFLMESLNDKLKLGIPLPIVFGTSLANVSLTLNDRYLYMTSNMIFSD